MSHARDLLTLALARVDLGASQEAEALSRCQLPSFTSVQEMLRVHVCAPVQRESSGNLAKYTLFFQKFLNKTYFSRISKTLLFKNR